MESACTIWPDGKPAGTWWEIDAGTSFGDVFRTGDMGGSWSPLNSGQIVGSISSVVIDPSAPANVYAGTSGSAVVHIAHATIFSDGFESGDSTSWSSTVP